MRSAASGGTPVVDGSDEGCRPLRAGGLHRSGLRPRASHAGRRTEHGAADSRAAGEERSHAPVKDRRRAGKALLPLCEETPPAGVWKSSNDTWKANRMRVEGLAIAHPVSRCACRPGHTRRYRGGGELARPHGGTGEPLLGVRHRPPTIRTRSPSSRTSSASSARSTGRTPARASPPPSTRTSNTSLLTSEAHDSGLCAADRATRKPGSRRDLTEPHPREHRR